MAKHYNLDYLNSISGGDQEFVMDMIQTFITDAPAEISKIQKHLESGDFSKVGEEAHRFASSLLFLGLDNLKKIAVEIEELGINNTDTGKIAGLLEELNHGCRKIILDLKQDFHV